VEAIPGGTPDAYLSNYAQMPKEMVIENLKLLMRDIKPALDEFTPHTEKNFAAEH
jgi:hypothetical protein